MSDREETPNDDSNPPDAENSNASAADEEPTESDTDKEPPTQNTDDSEPVEKETQDDESPEEAKKNGSDVENGVSAEPKTKVEKLEGILTQMKGFVYRTDVSATEKVNQIKRLLDEADGKPKEVPKPAESNKRPAEENKNGEPKPKMPKNDNEDGEDRNSDDEDGVIDSCVVCGLYLEVFKEDKAKELQHYLSHGFNILKEFEILKPDDALFLCCNLCTSIYPRKCHVNYRKHLISDHTDRIVEIFREIWYVLQFSFRIWNF